MPTGKYARSAAVRAAMSARAKAADISLRLQSADVKAAASAARRLVRPRARGYVATGGRNTPFMLLHRARAEAVLGHPLPSSAPIHHPDRDVTNPSARLVICENAAYHALLHWRERIIGAGGNPNVEKPCSRCKAMKPFVEFNKNSTHLVDGLDYFCRSCIREKNEVQRRRQGSRV